MTVNLTHRPGGPAAAPAPLDADVDHLLDEHDGWQALALASLGRLLSDTELAAAEHLPVGIAVDLFFPHLDDASRHEALSALG
jgi:hypothetical protein